MARFVAGTQVTTREPAVAVDAGLPPGTHRFALQVVASDGRRSPPVEALVTVARVRVPVPVPGPVIGPVTPILRPSSTASGPAANKSSLTPNRREG